MGRPQAQRSPETRDSNQHPPHHGHVRYASAQVRGTVWALPVGKVDEIHNLDHHTRAGADASDHLKYLAENVAATFVYAGIDTAKTGLFNGIRGRQLAGRFVPIHTRPYPYATTGDRDQWRALVVGFDSMLRLDHHKPGRLSRLAPYLYGRTAGSISSLSMLIRSVAVTVIMDGTEKITKANLDDVPLDHAAATATTTRRGRRTTPAGAEPPAA